MSKIRYEPKYDKHDFVRDFTQTQEGFTKSNVYLSMSDFFLDITIPC